MSKRSPASVLAALEYFRDEQQRLYPRSAHARYYQIAAEAIERVNELEAELAAAREDSERLEAERDKFHAQVVSKDEWICQWITYANSTKGRMDSTIRDRFAQDIYDRFMRGEFDAVEWLRDRDNRMKSIGAEEELRRLAAEWIKRGWKRRVLAQELEARADQIKAERDKK